MNTNLPMSSDRFIFLLTKQFSSSLTTEEERELDLLLQDAANQQSYRSLKRFWSERESAKTPDVEGALQSVMAAIGREEVPDIPAKGKSNRQYALAAVFTLVGVIVFLVFRQTGPENGTVRWEQEASRKAMVEKQNAKGTRSIITLADGSKVWLNADSRLLYPTAFEGTTREVSLSGEAFFEVAKNPQKPFIIHLKNGTVRVLGTSFNIKAYDNSPQVETSVSTGRVAFIPVVKKGRQKRDSVILQRDEKLVYTVGSGTVETVATASAEDRAWTEGKLIFSGASLEEIAVTLERNFGKQVLINDDVLRTYHLTGSFENNTLEEILYYLSKSKPFTYRITETQIILSALR